MTKHGVERPPAVSTVGNEIEAERIEELKRLRKNDKRKQALVWLVKSRTVAGHEWILDRLEMGHRSNVTRAMAGFRNGGDRETKGLKAKMIKCSDSYLTMVFAKSRCHGRGAVAPNDKSLGTFNNID